MKRSRIIRLVLLGSGSLVLTACEQPVEVQSFASAEECRARGLTGCDRLVNEAYRRHMALAPRFETHQNCEREYGAGNCEHTGGSHGGGFATGAWCRPKPAGILYARDHGGQPLYGSSGGSFRTLNGERVGSGLGTGGTVTRAALAMPEHSPVVWRGESLSTGLQRAGFGTYASSGGS